MKIIWILLVFSTYIGHGVTASQYSFQNAAACEAAVKWYRAQSGMFRNVDATCLADPAP